MVSLEYISETTVPPPSGQNTASAIELWVGLGLGLITNSDSTSTELYRLMLHCLQFLPENTDKLDLFRLRHTFAIGNHHERNLLQGHITW